MNRHKHPLENRSLSLSLSANIHNMCTVVYPEDPKFVNPELISDMTNELFSLPKSPIGQGHAPALGWKNLPCAVCI